MATDSILLDDFELFAGKFWKIYDKMGNRVSFRPNPAQRLMLHKLRGQRAKGKLARVRVLKYRQAGSSLLWTLFLLHRTLVGRGFTALSIANTKDLPQQWLRVCHELIEQVQAVVESGAGPHVKASNAIEIFLDRQQSRYYINSAEGKTPGMGATIQHLHCSEVASWENPEEVLGDLLPAIPPGRETLIIQESTGRSIGDWWYQRYFEAKEGACEYVSVFLPWFIQPEYSIPATWETLGQLTEREQELVARAKEYAQEDGRLVGFTGITPSQLAWRRMTVSSDFHGDEDKAGQQYPSTEIEGFLAGGKNVFTPEQTALARKTIRPPVKKYNILLPGNPQQYRMDSTDSGDLFVWEHPDERYHYVLGADCQWGDRDTADWDVLYVECLETGKTCARLMGHFDLSRWGKLVAAVGFHYNTCVIAPERNARAADSLMPLLLGNVADWSYPNVYVRVDDVKFRGHRPQDYGWFTSAHTKHELVAYAQTATLDGRFDWADELAVRQMEAYVSTPDLKMSAPVGMNDDCLMARMITAYVAHVERARTDLYKPPQKKVLRLRTMVERVAEMIGA